MKYAQAFGAARARWLLWREAIGDTRQVAWKRNGLRLYLRLNTTDILVWASIFERDEYGAELPLRPRVIVDAGAYTGLSTVYFAHKYPQARVIALEPDASNYKLLVRNTRSFPNIIALNKALWFEGGLLQLYDRQRGHWAFSVAPPKWEAFDSGEQIDAVTVDGIMAMFDVDVIDVLKVDVEGAEKEIFEHCSAWIAHVGSIFAELHDRLRPGCTEAFEAATASFERRGAGPMTTLRINRHLATRQ